MSLIRRLTGIVTGTLVLQLVLLGAAAPCTESAGATMNDVMASLHDQHGAVPASNPGSEECAEHSGSPADAPASGAPSCIAMVSCVTPLMQFAVHVPVVNLIAQVSESRPPDIAPASRNTVPEPPPPRV